MKKYLLGVIALILAVSVSAFKAAATFDDFDYVMVSGDPADPDDRVNPLNYERVPGGLICDPPDQNPVFCKIHAEEGAESGLRPRIDESLDADLFDALNVEDELPEEVPNVVEWTEEVPN